jgi:hypothetical protein
VHSDCSAEPKGSAPQLNHQGGSWGMKASQTSGRRVHDEGGNLLHRLRADSVVDLL